MVVEMVMVREMVMVVEGDGGRHGDGVGDRGENGDSGGGDGLLIEMYQ